MNALEIANTVGRQPNKEAVPWRSGGCGGPLINGTPDYIVDDESKTINPSDCKCHPQPTNVNYVVSYQFVQGVYTLKLHLTSSGEEWNKLPTFLFTNGCFKKYKEVSGPTLKVRWDGIFKSVATKHDLPVGETQTSQGFETHNNLTIYDSLVIKMIKEFQAQTAKKEADKIKEQAK